MSNETTAGLLQTVEHTSETIRRMAVVIRELLEAQRTGQPVPATTLATYEQWVDGIEQDRERLQERIAQYWAMLGREEAH